MNRTSQFKLHKIKEEFRLSYRKKSFSGKWRRHWRRWGPPVDTMAKIEDLIDGCKHVNTDCMAIEFKLLIYAKAEILSTWRYK